MRVEEKWMCIDNSSSSYFFRSFSSPSSSSFFEVISTYDKSDGNVNLEKDEIGYKENQRRS